MPGSSCKTISVLEVAVEFSTLTLEECGGKAPPHEASAAAKQNKPITFFILLTSFKELPQTS
ncbi:hypothetical protein GCM10017783_21560 [Deinococcus piscis]|uniref:Uncharacterized protein n=1 Tax=Deinococcus piscis TaxID=394230 RepID=A0ABQ3KBX8_9DEIO|nr:hypothetical protein GCM10017783_21560 [Deinococcus piscis]